MKSGDAYRFSLSWPMRSEEHIMAGEFLNKMGNKKSRFVVQLICEYLNAHPEAMDPKETFRFIVNSTSFGERLTDIIRSVIQTELAGKTLVQQGTEASDMDEQTLDSNESVDAMLEFLESWNAP